MSSFQQLPHTYCSWMPLMHSMPDEPMYHWSPDIGKLSLPHIYSLHLSEYKYHFPTYFYILLTFLHRILTGSADLAVFVPLHPDYPEQIADHPVPARNLPLRSHPSLPLYLNSSFPLLHLKRIIPPFRSLPPGTDIDTSSSCITVLTLHLCFPSSSPFHYSNKYCICLSLSVINR